MMHIGIYADMVSPEAEAYARCLAEAVSCQVQPLERVTFFNRHHTSAFVDALRLGLHTAQGASGRGWSRILSSRLSRCQIDRCHLSIDLLHYIGAGALRDAAPVCLPFVSELPRQAVGNRCQDAALLRLDRLIGDIRQCPIITTWSHDIRNQLIADWGCAASRVAVIPPGVDDLFRVAAQPVDELELQAIGLLPRQFFLTVGPFDDQAALSALLMGYTRLPARVKAWLPLVVMRRRGRGGVEVPPFAGPEVDSGNIRFIENIPIFMLRVLYQNARLVLCPSVTGGIGLSVSEAICCGARVAVGRGANLNSLSGPFANYIEPFDADHWCNTLSDYVDFGAHEAKLARETATTFSWQQSALAAIAVYRNVMTPASEVAQ